MNRAIDPAGTSPAPEPTRAEAPRRPWTPRSTSPAPDSGPALRAVSEAHSAPGLYLLRRTPRPVLERLAAAMGDDLRLVEATDDLLGLGATLTDCGRVMAGLRGEDIPADPLERARWACRRLAAIWEGGAR